MIKFRPLVLCNKKARSLVIQLAVNHGGKQEMSLPPNHYVVFHLISKTSHPQIDMLVEEFDRLRLRCSSEVKIVFLGEFSTLSESLKAADFVSCPTEIQ